MTSIQEFWMHKLGSFLCTLVFSCAALAGPTKCAQHFADNEAPEFINQKLSARATLLCFNGFAVMHSGISRTPIWSAEHLATQRLDTSKVMKRHNNFHPESQLPLNERAELHDYARSGFDRGHMSPSGDMPDPAAQFDSFSLANMVPQDPKNNQLLWAGLEGAIRKMARRRGELYVVTGPIFEGDSLQRLNQRVLVPTLLFKAVYDPAAHSAGAYLAPNAPGGEYEVVTIEELERRSGLNLFPTLDPAIKRAGMRLPEPGRKSRKYR